MKGGTETDNKPILYLMQGISLPAMNDDGSGVLSVCGGRISNERNQRESVKRNSVIYSKCKMIMFTQ